MDTNVFLIAIFVMLPSTVTLLTIEACLGCTTCCQNSRTCLPEPARRASPHVASSPWWPRMGRGCPFSPLGERGGSPRLAPSRPAVGGLRCRRPPVKLEGDSSAQACPDRRRSRVWRIAPIRGAHPRPSIRARGSARFLDTPLRPLNVFRTSGQVAASANAPLGPRLQLPRPPRLPQTAATLPLP